MEIKFTLTTGSAYRGNNYVLIGNKSVVLYNLLSLRIILDVISREYYFVSTDCFLKWLMATDTCVSFI